MKKIRRTYLRDLDEVTVSARTTATLRFKSYDCDKGDQQIVLPELTPWDLEEIAGKCIEGLIELRRRPSAALAELNKKSSGYN